MSTVFGSFLFVVEYELTLFITALSRSKIDILQAVHVLDPAVPLNKMLMTWPLEFFWEAKSSCCLVGNPTNSWIRNQRVFTQLDPQLASWEAKVNNPKP